MAEITTGAYNYDIRPVTQTQPGTTTPSADQRGQEALSRLSSGQTIEGRVVSVETAANGTRSAQIDLGGGAQVTARLDSAMALTEGSTVTFQVRTGADGQINLNPLYQNTAMDSSALRAIAMAGMEADASTMQMVREMMSSGLSIDRESLQTFARAMTDFPDTGMTTLLQMRGLDLPLTENNIAQFQHYQNYQHQIVNSMNDIMNGLPHAFTTMTQTGQAVQALDMYGALMRLFTTPEEQVIDPEYRSADAAEATPSVLGDVTSGLPGSPEGQATLMTQEGLEAALQGLLEAEDNPETAQGMRTEAQLLIADENAQAAGMRGHDPLSGGVPARMYAPDGTPLTQDAGGSPQEAHSFAENARALGLPETITANSPQEMLRLLSEQYQQTAHTSPETDLAWTKLFSSEEFTTALKDTMTSQWLLRPEDVGEKGNVEELYTRLKSHTQQLTGLLSQTLGSNTQLAQNVQQLNGNLDFMNQLNQMFQYVQLPLQMANANTHGDLYVYTNRKSLARDDGTVSAILHLDMEALGPLDVYVKMHEQKVNTNFYVADDAVLDLIAEHIDELNERLAKRGYTMDCRMMLQSEMSGEDAAVDEMLKVSPGSVGIVSEQSFDARA